MRAATYSRVSTEDQVDNYSIPTQLEAIHEYASERDIEVVKDCIDPGVTGATLDRTALNELRQLARSRQVDLVIAYDPDRLSRSLAHLLILSNEFEKAGVELTFVTQPIGKTPEDRMLFNVRGVFAEYERTKILERTMRGRMQKARDGMQPGGKAPYGYGIVDGRHVINEEEAQVVRMIFGWLSKEGMTLLGIQQRLNAMQIPTRRGTKFWQRSNLHRIVREEAYVGNWHYNKTAQLTSKTETISRVKQLRPREEWICVSIPAIISEETFEAAKRQLKKNAEFSKRNVKRQYLLTGLIKCGKCGYRYNARTLKETVYYSCNSKQIDVESPSCGSRMVRGDIIEPLVWNSVRELLGKPEFIIDQMEKQSQAGGITYLEERLQTVNRAIKRKTLEVDRFLEAYKVGAIDSILLKREMDKIKEEQQGLIETKQDIESQLQEAGEQDINADYIERFCKNYSLVLDTLSFEEKRLVLREVIERIEIRDSDVSIWGIVPMQDEWNTTPMQKQDSEDYKLSIASSVSSGTASYLESPRRHGQCYRSALSQ